MRILFGMATHVPNKSVRVVPRGKGRSRALMPQLRIITVAGHTQGEIVGLFHILAHQFLEGFYLTLSCSFRKCADRLVHRIVTVIMGLLPKFSL